MFDVAKKQLEEEMSDGQPQAPVMTPQQPQHHQMSRGDYRGEMYAMSTPGPIMTPEHRHSTPTPMGGHQYHNTSPMRPPPIAASYPGTPSGPQYNHGPPPQAPAQYYNQPGASPHMQGYDGPSPMRMGGMGGMNMGNNPMMGGNIGGQIDFHQPQMGAAGMIPSGMGGMRPGAMMNHGMGPDMRARMARGMEEYPMM